MKRALWAAAIVVWFGAITAVLAYVWSYKSTPDAPAAAPAQWPTASAIVRVDGKPDLIVFTHPQCPCTRATMSELAKLATELDGAATIHVVLVRPDGTDPGFEDGAIADRAHAIAGVDVLVDVGGVEAARFGAVASGSTVLYSPAGELQFTGGLTTARGHEGRSPAADHILAAVAGRDPDRRDSPVFGCALAEPKTIATNGVATGATGAQP